MMRNITPISQAFSVLAVVSAIGGYVSAALAVAVVTIGIEIMVTAALNQDEE